MQSTLVALAAFWSVTASAQSATSDIPAEVTADEAVELMLRFSPDLSAARAWVEAVRAEEVGAALRPNPEIEFDAASPLLGTNTVDGASVGLLWVQPFELARQRDARLRVARASHEVANTSMFADFVDVAVELHELHADLRAAQARVAVLDPLLETLERAERVIEGRVEAGVESEYDLHRIRLERAERLALRASLESERRTASRALAEAVGLEGWEPVASGRVVDLSSIDELPVAGQDHPSAVHWTAEARRAEEAADLAVRERWQPLAVGLGPAVTTTPASLSILATLSLELPTANRGQGERAIAEAERAAALAERDAAVARLSRQATRAQSAMNDAIERLRWFESTVLTALPGLLTMAEAAYVAGEAGILEVLDAVANEVDLSLEHVDLQAEVAEAIIQAQSAAGRIQPRLEPLP